MFDVTDLEELRRGILRTILIRRITLGVFSAVALLVLLTSPISYLNPLFYSPLVWFLLTFPFGFLVTRQCTTLGIHRVHTGFFVIEVLLITVLVHFMGGSEWIGVTFYMFTVIYANTFLTRFHGALITLLVVLSFSSLVLLEYAGVIPHRSLFSVAGELHRNLTYTVTTILAGAIGLYAVVALTVRAFADAFIHKTRVLAHREEQLAALSRQLLGAEDEERRRIARSLHDDLIQTLAAIKLRLAPHRERLGAESFAEVCGIVDRSIQQTRTLAYSVRPPLLDDLGLTASLQRLAESVKAESQIDVSVHASLPTRPPIGVESLIYAVAHEAVQNAVRHARPAKVIMTLSAEEGLLRLRVRDDGIGVQPDTPQGFGLRGIAQRVEVSGGRFSIASLPEGGTVLRAEVPFHAHSCSDR